MDEDERRRKVEAGRAKLASYRQKRAKGDASGETKKTQKRKGPAVSQIQSATAQDAELNSKANHEKPTETEKLDKSGVHQQQNRQQRDPAVVSAPSQSPATDLKEDELVALTGKEQLKQLQEAVEKRNEIIAKLSSNLQEALTSRDQVQLEAHSLAGQIQALQKQLQQTSAEFLRIKSHAGGDVGSSLPQHQHQGNSAPYIDIVEKEASVGGLRKFGLEPQSGFQSNDDETDTTLQKLRAQLEEERENTRRLSAELAQEIEEHRLALSLLEEERKDREEERQERGTQLRDLQTQLDLVQTQCLEMQQFKAEKENLNREVQELTHKLQVKEDAERRLCAEVQASSEEIRRLKEELEEGQEGVRQLLDAREVRLKDSKNRHNQAKAGLGCDEGLDADKSNVESEFGQNSINVPISGDALMERYLSAALPERSQYFSANDSFEHGSQVDASAENSFELNSEVLGDEPLLSISNRFPERSDSLCDNLSPRGSLGVSEADSSNLQYITQWNHGSTLGEQDTSKLSEQQIEGTDLEKELLNQQCRELREELDMKDRDLNVLREEVLQNEEELEEARNRWAQVTDELKEALWELEAEKEKRRHVEEQMNTRAQEQDNLKNKLSALMEEREKATDVMLLGQDADCSQRVEEKQLHDQQTQCDFLTLELNESKTTEKSTAALLDQRTEEFAEASKEVETVRAKLLDVQTEMERLRDGAQKTQESLDEADKDKRELESQIFCLRQNLANLEEAQSQAVHEREVHRRKEEEMSERIRKMEQVLEEEVEQFESLLKAKDEEVTQEREKWEEERQEKDKELFAVRRHLEEQRSKWEEEVKALLEKQATSVEEVTDRLQMSHKEEIGRLQERHQQEISDLNAQLESELLRLQAKMEEEQKKQISLIKQVTEREHERMLSELSAKHDDELARLRESMEAAHQAELEQAQIKKSSEFEALRLSLTDAHVSKIEHSRESLEQEHQSALAKVQHSLEDKFNQERAVMQARHQSEMDQTMRRNQEQQQKVQERHEQMTNELKEQWEKTAAQEKAAMEEKHANEIQALQSKWEKDAESADSVLRASLSETQNKLSAAQAELASTQTSLSQKDGALAETQASLSKIQSELQESLARLADLQLSSEEQSRKLEEELKQALSDRDAAARSLEELVSSNEAVLKEKDQQARRLEDKEQELQKEVSRLQEEQELLKQNSADEIGQLWSQLESMRASRQELGELKEQLLARSSRVDDIERLKTEFSHQKQEIKEQNEAEMENLRRYFEQRLRVAEETYREEIALLQLRLVESALEESVLKTTEGSFLSAGQVEEDKDHSLVDPDLTHSVPKGKPDGVQLQMDEKHSVDLSNLQSSMAHSFKEELQQVRSDLTDHYYNQLQELKTHHALDQEKLRAKLSDRHLQEINKVRLEASHQVEVEIEQRIWFYIEELQAVTIVVHALENTLFAISQDHEAEKQKLAQELKWDFSEELKKFQEQVQHQLDQTEQTIEEEKSLLQKALAQKYETSLTDQREKHQAELQRERAALLHKHAQETDTLTAKHKAQVESLSASHSAELTAAAAKLESKHSAELVALEVALGSKRQADLDSLEAAFRETSQAQLEAREAELSRNHQEEMDELEKRLLDNMETVEATYLKEVQALREEIGRLEEKQQRDLNCQKSEHRQEMEKHAAEQLTLREELREELAQVHIEKFSAMAAELSQVHKSELIAQKEALDTDHCRALESLKKQVLELEQQHGAALLQLTQSCKSEKEELVTQHELQLQELRGASARELEACRRELEEESSRQRQHFLEEVELLKVQSEERLKDRINQLKTEFEEEKQAELDSLRRSFTSEQEEKERSYTGKMSELTAQLQQLDAVVAQLRSEVGCLQADLSGKRAEMETLNTLLQRREREGQEGGNLVKMLTDDLRTAKEESHKLDQANTKLRKVLIEMIRSTVATEELIGQKICSRAKSSEIQSVSKDSPAAGILVADSSSDDPELTHMLCESLLISDAQITPEGEEASQSACSRLHQAVDTLLELLNQANKQLEQTHDVHLSLEEKFSRGKEDSAHLLEQHKLVMEQLDQEAKLKTELQLKLHKAEGLVDGYVADKAALEESLQQKEAQEERLVEELEDLKVKLHQAQGLAAELESLRAKHQELSEEHSVVLRQKEHLSAGLGEREKALLAETDRLAQDRIDLQRQAERDTSLLSQRLKAMERELEEQETKGLETAEQHKSHTEDLSQQVQALEKQLKNNRQFIEEQAIEREHERDDFQQEIRRLETQLRQTAGVDGKGHRVESLQAIIRDKTDDHAALLTANQKAQRDLEERNDEIDKLAGRIRELEQALLNSTESNRGSLQLEQELHRVKLREQELLQDKQALEQQQVSNRLQISALQSKLDETRHCYHDNARDPTQELRDALDAAQQSLRTKEQEVESLQGQLESVQRDLSIKEVELKHLALQLELLTNQNSDRVTELQEQIDVLTENVAALSVQKKEMGAEADGGAPVEEMLSSALLEEKNQEIDHLSDEIQKLEQELESTKNNKVLEAELEDLHSQVEHLQSEIMRVREDRKEEEERLHEVISTLQAELATLGPNLHEVSDSQDGDSINPSPAVSPEPNPCSVQDQQRPGGPNSLKQELNLTHSATVRSHQSLIKTLQTELETAVTEKEALERLLLTQEEEYQGHGKELGNRLKAERERAEELQGHLAIKEAELEEVKKQMEQEQERRKLSEEERDGCKVEMVEARALREKNEHMSSLVEELKHREQESLSEIRSLQAKRQGMKTEMEALRESSLTLERQVREVRAEVVDMEELVAEERTKVQTLEAVKGELSAERSELRAREKQLQEEVDRLRQEVASLGARVLDLTAQLQEKEAVREQDQKEVLTHAEATLAKADAALRAKEGELGTLKSEHQTLRAELTTVKQSLSSSRERSDKLEEEAQTKDQALVDLESDNQRLNAELQSLQDDLAAQGEELSCQRRELHRLKQLYHQQETLSHRQNDTLHGAFEEALSLSQSDECLSSPEVLRRIECSEDRIAERFRVSAVGSHLSELSGLNHTGVELAHYTKTSPGVVMEPQRSRTITPDPPSRTSHSPGSVSMSENFSVLDSLDTDRVNELEGLDHTRPPSPLDSTSSLSAREWASDGYGSNVSSELGARLRVELEQTERLDAQFVEYLRCRGINPTANTDSAAGSMSYSEDLLSPELQGLLKKVYQESCRILTLSQRRPTASSQLSAPDVKLSSQTQYHAGDGGTLLDHGDKPSSDPPMSWQQEKRALQETVIALREMLCRMAQRQPQTDYRGEDGWNREQVESQLRAELEASQEQLKCAHNIQQEQKSKLQTLGLAVDGSNEALRREQSRVQELQQQLEQERAMSARKNREEEEKRGAQQASTGQQKAEVTTLRAQVEQERVACSNLRQELQIEQSRSVLLEKRLQDTHRELEEEHQSSALKLERSLQEKTSLERLLSEAESHSAEKLRHAHRKLDEERERRTRQVDELSRRHEMDAASDRQFICDLRTQLEQERRQGQDMASTTDKLRMELLQSRRNWEEEDRARREELQKLQEAAARHRAAVEALKEHKQEAGHALELERERVRHHATQLAELKERVRLLKDKEREREEQWQRERTKVRQEQVDREKRQDRTNNKLCELEMLRRQDQQRLQELQQTLAELQREEKEMAAHRLSGQTARQRNEAPSSHYRQAGGTPKHQQRQPSPDALETLLKENSELTERVTSLSQEKASLKHTLASLERQLRRTESELARVSTDSENRPISDLTSNSKVQRLYERYLRAESFRKALVYQKRYLLLLLGGFQECEQATLCLIATMGVSTSPSLSSQRSPLGRFRAAARVVVAVSRMRFLTRKWQKAIKRLSLSGSVNGHPSGNKVEVLRQQQPRIIADSPSNRDAIAALVPPTKSPFRLHNRSYSSASLATAGPSHDPEPSLTDYIHHLEKVQQRLVGPWQALKVFPPTHLGNATQTGLMASHLLQKSHRNHCALSSSDLVSKTHLAPPPKEERRIQPACSPTMIGYRQRWLQENRTWLYLSCLSPLYLYGPGSPALQRDPKPFDH